VSARSGTRRPSAARTGTDDPSPAGRGSLRSLSRPDHLHAAGVSLLVLILYGLTACPTIYTGDSAELAAAASRFGVPHPPGYPLYTLLTGLSLRVLFFLQPAHAANLMSAAYGALAVGATWLLVRRLGAGRPACAFGALSLGLGATFWSQSLVAEVYTFDLLLLLAVLHAGASFRRTGGGRSSLAMGLLVGLWLGHRPLNVVYIPALIVFLSAWGRIAWRSSEVRALLGGIVLGALPYLYLPLASAANPPIDVGNPETWEGFRRVVTGAPYRRHLESSTPGLALGRLLGFVSNLPREAGLAWLAAIVGVVGLVRRGGFRRRIALSLVVLVATNLVLAANYNIPYIEVYFLPALTAIALLGSLGAAAILDRIRKENRRGAAFLVWGAALAASLALIPVNLASNDLAGRRAARRLAEDLLDSAGPEAVLFVHGDTVTHTLWYLQAVEDRAPGVIVVSTGHLSGWYLANMAERFPLEPWPGPMRGATPEELAYLVLDRLGPRHRVMFGFNPAEVVRVGGRNSRWAQTRVAPRGLALELRDREDSEFLADLAAWSARFWSRATEGILPVREDVNAETRTIYLDYALALARNAEFFHSRGRRNLAGSLYQGVLRFHPDRQEEAIREALSRVGREAPRLQLEARATKALQALRGSARGG
jgi:hypothetical protein